MTVDGTVVAERSAPAEGSHAVSLLPLIDAVLRQSACSVAALDAIAVSTGPGSFTGLRIGLSVAKGLACATGLHLVAVPTLEALARTVTDAPVPVCALLDARKGELYAACFAPGAQGFRRLTDDMLLTPEALLARLPRPCTVVGDAVVTYGEFLQRRLGGAVTLLPFDTHSPRGGVVAGMGAARLRAGTADPLSEIEPRYIRPSEAELKSA